MVRQPKASAPLASPDEIEQQFYEALRAADIERFMAVWSDDDDIACVQPGGPRLVGAAAIRASFEAMFANGGLPIHIEHVRRIESHGSSVHCVVEQVRGMTPDGPGAAWVFATNVYVATADGWRLVVHHASPGSAQPSSEASDSASGLLH